MPSTIFGAFFAVLAGLLARLVPDLVAVGLWAACTGTAALLFAALFRWRYRRDFPRRAEIRSGHVHIADPGSVASFPLQDCQWFVRTIRDDKYGAFLADEPAVIVDTPRRWYACAVSDAIPVWTECLRLAGVRHIRPPSRFRVLLWTALACLLGVAFVFSSMFVGGRLGVPRAMALSIAVVTAVMGAFWAAFWASWAWPGSRVRETIHPAGPIAVSGVLAGYMTLAGAGLPLAFLVGVGHAAIAAVLCALVARRSDPRSGERGPEALDG